MLRQLRQLLGSIGTPAPDGPAAPPGNAPAEAHFAHAMALLDAGRLEEALTAFDRVLHSNPRAAAAHFNRGSVLTDLGRATEALADYDRAIAIQPRFVDAHVGRARTLAKLRRPKDAFRSIDTALALSPNAPEALEARADLLREQGRAAEAASVYERLLALDPENSGALNNRGIVLQDLRRLPEALAAHDAALRIDPASAEAHTNRGLALTSLGRYGEALACHERALRLDPDSVAAQLNEATCRLMLGDFPNGWKQYESRWRNPWWVGTQGFYGQQAFDRPLWLGDAPVAGKRIFLHPEQGLGDTVQFSRYAEPLARAGATVLLEVQPQLRALLQGMRGVSELSSVGEAVPAHDLHCPLMSLPLACGTTLETIPLPQGYLRPELAYPEKVEHWRGRLAANGRHRVGVVWSGNAAHRNDANRSIPFQQFAPLLSERHDFYCLQNEIRQPERQAVKRQSHLTTLRTDLADFADTAALIANLDLVICVDTAVAHVAGAMGKPVWLLLPADPDWRWLVDRGDSPWYASMRLFRQSAPGDWMGVIESVRGELEAFGRA